MRDVVILFVHLFVIVVRLIRPGGLRSVVAESAILKYQLLILNRGRKRAPNLRAADRVIACHPQKFDRILSGLLFQSVFMM